MKAVAQPFGSAWASLRKGSGVSFLPVRRGKWDAREREGEQDEARDTECRTDPVDAPVRARVDDRLDGGSVVVNQGKRDRRGVERERRGDGEEA